MYYQASRKRQIRWLLRNRSAFLLTTGLSILLPTLLGFYQLSGAHPPTLPWQQPAQQPFCAHSFTIDTDTFISRLILSGNPVKDIKEKLYGTSPYKIRKIIIDPGHGGLDSGCLGSSSQEKHLALSIALKLGEHISRIYPDIQILFTRTTDVFIPLHERARLANRSQADLFISIHCNYAEYSKKVNGTETYVMGIHTAEYNLEVAKRENASILLEENYQQNYGGYDPNSPEGHIILSMYQNAFLEQSINFAEKIEQQFAAVAGRKSRGVKQAGFVVLKETAMPSVLIETGFLSNAEEEYFLFSQRGQDLIANSLLRAFTAYKREVESENQQIASLPTLSAPNLRTPSPVSSGMTKPEADEPVASVKPEKKPMVLPSPSQDAPPAEPTKKPASEPAKSESTAAALKESPKATFDWNPGDPKPFIQFKVLFLVTLESLATDDPKWRKIDCLVEIKKVNGSFHYLATGFHSYEEAASAKEMLRNNGFDEAFVIAFADGKRIDVQQARSIIAF